MSNTERLEGADTSSAAAASGTNRPLTSLAPEYDEEGAPFRRVFLPHTEGIGKR